MILKNYSSRRAVFFIVCFQKLKVIRAMMLYISVLFLWFRERETLLDQTVAAAAARRRHEILELTC